MLIKNRTAASLVLLSALLTLLLSRPGGTRIGSAAPSAANDSFLPAILTPAIDFTISHVEISQAVQKVNNSVPLVSGRKTIMRVFALVTSGSSPGNITVSLAASRNGVPLGSISSAPRVVPSSPTRANFSSTYNLFLPASWLSGDIVVVAKVDAAGTVSESNENNNSLQSLLSFKPVPPLDIRIVPINYTHQGSSDPGNYPGQEDDRIKDWIRRAFPVESVTTSFRTPYLSFQGNLDQGAEWSRLLNALTALKLFDGAPTSQFYYGLVPIRNGGDQWFHGGIAGIGWTAAPDPRASVGLNLPSLNDTGILAGHEIGHNMGRRHAPCGVTKPDLSYPYAGASIGEFGIEINGTSASLLSPSGYVDMMSYCSPEWISDYTYVALYNDQRANGLTLKRSAAPGLVIRARLDENGAAVIEPVYALDHIHVSEPQDSFYQFTLLDSLGTVVSTRRAAVLEAEEPGVRSTAFYASFPLPGVPVATVQLKRAGVLVQQRRLSPASSTAARTVTMDRGSSSNSLAWNSPELPALIRYTADNGQTWTTLGIDVLGGRLEFDRQSFSPTSGRFEVTLADDAQSRPRYLTLDSTGQN